MTEKKPYSPPQLYEVTLDQEQAILTACSLTTMTRSQPVSARTAVVSTAVVKPPCAADQPEDASDQTSGWCSVV